MKKSSLTMALTLAFMLPGVPVFAQEEGTLGLTVQQLYTQAEASHRGNLVVLEVQPKSAADDAGIRAGEVILEVNGKPVTGRDLGEIRRNELGGPVGGTVRLKVVSLRTGEPRDVTLIRRPYQPYENPATDLFHYSGPGNWRSERHRFPLPWAPSIPYHGLADLLFAPAFSDENSPDFFSYTGFWWIEGKPKIDAAGLRGQLLAYYRGLSEDFARGAKTTVDLDHVSVEIQPVAERTFRAEISTYSFAGKLITLHADATVTPCAESDHTVIFFRLTPQDRSRPVWTKMKAIGDSFVCKR